MTDESSDHLGAPLQDDVLTLRHAAATTTAQARDGNGHCSDGAANSSRDQTAATSRGRKLRRAAPPPAAPTGQSAANGTVVLDVDSGVVVPSFLGKPLRSAVETRSSPGWRSMRSAAAWRANNGPRPAASCRGTTHHGALYALTDIDARRNLSGPRYCAGNYRS